MSAGTWEALSHELHVEKARADAEHRVFDCADAMAAVAHWINVPLPRRSPDDLLGLVMDDGRVPCVCSHCRERA